MREQVKVISLISGWQGPAEMTGVAVKVSLSSQGAAFVLLSPSYRGGTKPDLGQGVLEDILHKHDQVWDKGGPFHLGSCFFFFLFFLNLN